MYCPTCGNTYSEGQRFCRTCGTNLTIISKAVTLSEAIGRSDRGAWPKIKESLEKMKIEGLSGDIASGLEKLTDEIEGSLASHRDRRRRTSDAANRRREPRVIGWKVGGAAKPKPGDSAERRREKFLVDGFKGFLGGIGLMIFLYFVGSVLILRLPPERLSRLPFELEPVIRIAWLLGLAPTLSGLGQIIGSFFVRVPRPSEPALTAEPSSVPLYQKRPPETAQSVTEHTTELLGQSAPDRPRPEAAGTVK